MEQPGASPEAERSRRMRNTTESLRTTLEALTKSDPEMVDLATSALTNMVETLANARPGTQTQEIKGDLIGMAMVFNRADENTPGATEQPIRGTALDASRVGMFVNRVRNRVGEITEPGKAVVKIGLNLTARTTTVGLPK